MIAALLYIVLIANAILSLVYPWIGIVIAYVVTLLTPQNVWWWAFEGVRPSFWVLVPTLLGFLFLVIRGKANVSPLNTGLNRCVFVLWCCFTLAYYFGPYVDVVNDYRFYDPGFMFSTLQKTYLSYLVAVILIDNTQRIKAFSLAIVITVAYMTYWANAQYLFFGHFGRLGGPTALDGTGIYADENNFAVLFVIGSPFLLFLGIYLKRRLTALAIWALIPLSWHAVFLTASRGALLGIGAVMLVFTLRWEKKRVAAFALVAFAVAFAWQAGEVMKSRSSTITGYQEERSASTRLEAWEAAIGMMAEHPLTGVGFASFGQAFPDFSDKVPRVAHNTFFQIGGEWGVIAAITFLVLMFSTLNQLRKNGTRLKKLRDLPDGDFYYCLNESCLYSLSGFLVCSMFLSLDKYEVFYYLLILSNAAMWGSRQYVKAGEVEVSGIARPKRRQGMGYASQRTS